MNYLAEIKELMMKMGWANRLTILRIIALIPILILIHFPSRLTCFLAAFLFIIAAITDFFDGYIARREQQITNFGKFLDPLADKILICSIFIELVGLGWLPSWMIIIIIVRELAVTGLRAIAADMGVVIAADGFGKWKTGMQIAAVIPLLLHYPILFLPTHYIGMAFMYIALILTVFSGYNYFYNFYRQWREELQK